MVGRRKTWSKGERRSGLTWASTSACPPRPPSPASPGFIFVYSSILGDIRIFVCYSILGDIRLWVGSLEQHLFFSWDLPLSPTIAKLTSQVCGTNLSTLDRERRSSSGLRLRTVACFASGPTILFTSVWCWRCMTNGLSDTLSLQTGSIFRRLTGPPRPLRHRLPRYHTLGYARFVLPKIGEVRVHICTI